MIVFNALLKCIITCAGGYDGTLGRSVNDINLNLLAIVNS